MLLNNFEKVCCFTGYRPNKFPFPLNREDGRFSAFENNLIDSVFSLKEDECRTFISGMAIGFDILAAEAVLLLKQTDKSVRLICALPFPEQKNSYNYVWRERYDRIIASADEVINVSEEYSRGCYAVRNKFMVDNSDYVLTWFDGKIGGTANTLKYAAKKGRHIVNINHDFAEFSAEQTFFNI